MILITIFSKKQGTDEGDIGELRNVVYSDDRPTISLNDIKISTVLHEVKTYMNLKILTGNMKRK